MTTQKSSTKWIAIIAAGFISLSGATCLFSFPAIFKTLIGLDNTITSSDFVTDASTWLRTESLFKWLMNTEADGISGLKAAFFDSPLYAEWVAEGTMSGYVTGYASANDELFYLSCKYESGGNPDDVGGDNGWAYGKCQFDCRYDLLDFINYCYKKDPNLYAEFAPWYEMDFSKRTTLRSNKAFYAAWHAVFKRNPVQFETDQDTFMKNRYYTPVVSWMKSIFGIDVENRSSALKGCLLSHSIRNGQYYNSLKNYVKGINADSTDEEIIRTMYAYARTDHPGEIARWTLEEIDCLAMLNGTLDIYAPSDNAAGTINWSDRRPATKIGEAATIAKEDRMKWLFPYGTPKTSGQMKQYLTTVTVPILDADGNPSEMSLTVHKKLAAEYLAIFEDLYRIGFRIKKSDTYAYGWREMASNSSSRSHHSYGVAIDVNCDDNPAIYWEYEPDKNSPFYCNESVVAIFKAHGFYWGGDWSKNYYDPMHFSYTNH